MSRPSGLEYVWLPAEVSDQSALTSAELVEGKASDSVVLYVAGDPVTSFTVPPGMGARVLAQCGLERQSP